MPLTGPIAEGRSFFCPHCGALYAVTHSRLSKKFPIGVSLWVQSLLQSCSSTGTEQTRFYSGGVFGGK